MKFSAIFVLTAASLAAAAPAIFTTSNGLEAQIAEKFPGFKLPSLGGAGGAGGLKGFPKLGGLKGFPKLPGLGGKLGGGAAAGGDSDSSSSDSSE